MDSRSAPAPFGNTFAITNMTSGKKSDDFDPAAWAQDVGRTGLDVAMREAEAQSSVRARELVAPPPYPREPDHTEDGIDIIPDPQKPLPESGELLLVASADSAKRFFERYQAQPETTDTSV